MGAGARLSIMQQIDTHEAGTQLGALLERMEGGEPIIITRGGRPVAKLAPISAASEANLGAVFEEMDRLRVGNRLNDLSIRDLIEEGRR